MKRAVRVAAAIAVTLAVLWLLFTVVFPAVERRMEDPTLGTGTAVAAPR